MLREVRFSFLVMEDSFPTIIFRLDGYIGMALVGGAAALGTLLVAGLIRRARK